MTFLEAVNRVLRAESIISGDDDDLTSFAQTQHDAAINLAKIAVQDELTSLIAEEVLPFENATGTLTLVTDQRTYDLAADFIRFSDPCPILLKEDGAGNSDNTYMSFYKGGEDQIKKDFLDYREQSGTPNYFYMTTPTTVTVKTIGVFEIPDSNVNADVYRYYYEKDVSVTLETDDLPFNSIEAQTFARLCARHFKYLFATKQVREGLFPQGIDGDPTIQSARASLMKLLRPVKAVNNYGRHYA